jgi:hypothetical protein
LTPAWNDFPDLSTPILTVLNPSAHAAPVVAYNVGPTAEADMLADALSKIRIHDEFLNDADGSKTGLAMSTDWVLSQPTRRYFAAVNYATAAGAIIYNDNVTAGTGGIGTNPAALPAGAPYFHSALPYAGPGAGLTHAPVTVGANGADLGGAGNLILLNLGYGPVACLDNAPITAVYDREEGFAGGPKFSPGGLTPRLCGEVPVLSWGNSPVGAVITATGAQSTYATGWASITLDLGALGATYGLPMMGYAASSVKGFNQSYGAMWPLRWND